MFNFRGRLSRQDFWLTSVGLICLSFGIFVVAMLAAVLVPNEFRPLLQYPAILLLVVLGLGNVWMLIVAQVKRWHDLDRSGWWTLVSVVALSLIAYLNTNDVEPLASLLLHLLAIAGLLFDFVLLGFFNGTKGPNRFGADSISLGGRFELNQPFQPTEFVVPPPKPVEIVDRKLAHLAPPPGAVRCGNCGATSPETARFCGQCGVNLQDAAASATAQDLPTDSSGRILLLDDAAVPKALEVKIEQAPDWIIEDEPTSGIPMLGFHGRISRQEFWLTYFIMVICRAAAMLIFSIVFEAMRTPQNATAVEFFELILEIWLTAFQVWILLVAMVKRFHDLDRSGWWCLVWFVPLFGMLGSVIVAGFVPGTKGPNRFGNDPTAVRKVY